MTNRGFTLLEIMIALSVFAILSMVTAAAMHQAFDIRERLTIQADRLNEMQLAITIIERDTQQILDRSILGNEMHTFPSMIGQPTYFEFTRDGLANPLAIEQRSTLQRIAFLCKNNQLIRRKWILLDTLTRSHYQDKILLDHLTSCHFSYIAHNRQTLSSWQEQALKQDQSQEPLPMATQLTLNFSNWGKMSFLFILPKALYGN